MRPDVSEQLDGLRGILERIVAPELHDPYPADILAGVCATLETLSSGWRRVPAFLQWDAEMTVALLREVLATVDLDDALDTQLRVLIFADPPDAADLRALEARHAQARQALAEA